jgi:hypothetical protein
VGLGTIQSRPDLLQSADTLSPIIAINHQAGQWQWQLCQAFRAEARLHATASDTASLGLACFCDSRPLQVDETITSQSFSSSWTYSLLSRESMLKENDKLFGATPKAMS